MALETSSPPTLWVYSDTWAYVPLMVPVYSYSYINSLTGSYSEQQISAIEVLEASLKNRVIAAGGSQWDSLQGLWLRAMGNIEDSRLNLIDDQYHLVDTVSGTLIPFTGMRVVRDGVPQPERFEAPINPALIDSPQGVLGVYLTNEPDDWGGNLVTAGADHYIIEYIGGDSSVVAGFGAWASAPNPTNLSGAKTITADNFTLSYVRDQTGYTGEPGSSTWGLDDKVEFGYSDLPYYEINTYGAGCTFQACWVGFGKGWTEAETKAFHADIEACLAVLTA
jgi:hypothetical protein